MSLCYSRVFFDVLFDKNKILTRQKPKTKKNPSLCHKIAAEKIWVKEHRLLAPCELFNISMGECTQFSLFYILRCFTALPSHSLAESSHVDSSTTMRMNIYEELRRQFRYSRLNLSCAIVNLQGVELTFSKIKFLKKKYF